MSFPRRRESSRPSGLHNLSNARFRALDSRLRGNDESGAIKKAGQVIPPF
ncbi:MAG: pilus assembly protein PilS [Alphaproteobacteria bacterium]|nr:MAG: pilus assembly protein PilS [Alphaproteobacteria bacterium]